LLISIFLSPAQSLRIQLTLRTLFLVRAPIPVRTSYITSRI